MARAPDEVLCNVHFHVRAGAKHRLDITRATTTTTTITTTASSLLASSSTRCIDISLDFTLLVAKYRRCFFPYIIKRGQMAAHAYRARLSRRSARSREKYPRGANSRAPAQTRVHTRYSVESERQWIYHRVSPALCRGKIKLIFMFLIKKKGKIGKRVIGRFAHVQYTSALLHQRATRRESPSRATIHHGPSADQR